ncbi:PRDM10 [Branchiostoma lanceolatum]|uniref:PRDM10 protein n=1 Tax=Branchiostoma lanceolatum TaxID=7740 RepID=A0A8J9ZGJ9_BRALA|nr:PRDM10 [Branchiostoma lanceolatum]
MIILLCFPPCPAGNVNSRTLSGMSNDVNFDLLWCEECGKSLPGECQIHGTLLKVKDKVIPSRARLTLPHYLQLRELEIRPGNKQLLGVFAKKVIQKRTQFGPFEATLVTSIANLTNRDENKFLLQVFKNGKEYYLDTPNEDVCNWMMFVRPARNHAEQNMVAYQYRDKIYFSSTKPIEPHCELKVWYAADYAKRMNMQVLVKEEDELSCALQNKPQEIRPVSTLDFFKTENHTEPWKCSNCNNVFSTFALLEEHSCSAAVTVAAPPTTKTPKKKGRKRFGRKDHLTRHTKKSHCAEFLKIKESPDGSTSSQLLSPMEAPDLNFGSLPRDDSLPKLTINKGRPLTKAETKAFTNKLEPPPKVAMEISIETSNTNQDDGPMGLKLPGPAVITEPVNASTVDLGQLLGFLPLNSALNASIPISQPQTSLQGMNIPMTMSMTPQSTSSRISVQNHMTMSPTASLTSQIPFVPLSQSLPRFHQAFQ